MDLKKKKKKKQNKPSICKCPDDDKIHFFPKEIDPKSSNPCLISGEMSISNVLEAANPDKLGYLRLKKVIGGFPGNEVTASFTKMYLLDIEMDLSSFSSSATLMSSLEGIYQFSNLKTLEIVSFHSKDYFCVDLNQICSSAFATVRPNLSPSIKNLKLLREFKVNAGVFDGDVPSELFTLPKLEYLSLENMKLETQTFNTFVRLVGLSVSLKKLYLDKIKYVQLSELQDFPDLSVVFNNTPIQRLTFISDQGSLLAFRGSPSSVEPFLKLPHLIRLDVCGLFMNWQNLTRTFKLVNFNSTLNRKMKQQIGKDNSFLPQNDLAYLEGACYWSSTHSKC